MFFSNHHQNVVYDTWYPGPYTLYGDVLSVGTPVGQKRKVCVRAEDLDAGPGKLNPSKYKTLVIEAGVCGLEKGFVESFPNLKDLIVEADLDRIPLTPELEKLLKSNQVILRGVFNSAAEQLAKKLGLTFIHTNLLVARHFEECRYERTTLMLCFQKGSARSSGKISLPPASPPGTTAAGPSVTTSRAISTKAAPLKSLPTILHPATRMRFCATKPWLLSCGKPIAGARKPGRFSAVRDNHKSAPATCNCPSRARRCAGSSAPALRACAVRSGCPWRAAVPRP